MTCGGCFVVLNDRIIWLTLGRAWPRSVVWADKRIDASSLHKVRLLDLLDVNSGVVDVAQFKREVWSQLLLERLRYPGWNTAA